MKPAISLPVYFKSVKNMKICFTRKKTYNNKRTKKTKKKHFQQRELNPRPPAWKVNMLSIVPRQLVLKIPVKLIIFNTFADEILLVDAVKASRSLFMKN